MTALARGLDVLRAFRSGEERLSNGELAERCALPKSTITRLTYTLSKLGFLIRTGEPGRYRLGLATLALGGTTLSRLDIKEVSNPLLQALADATGTIVSLAIRDDLAMLYIDVCRTSLPTATLRLGIGTRLPIATSAVGRGYLVGAPSGARHALLTRIESLNTAQWPTIERGIQQALADYSAYGCVTSFGDWRHDVNAIAAPLNLGGGLPLMVINAGAAANAISAELFMKEVRPELVETVKMIRRKYRMEL